MTDSNDAHWMMIEGQEGEAPYNSRFESIGRKLHQRILTTRELMASTRHQPNIQLERFTGIHERRMCTVCTDSEDSFSLVVGAARDCVEKSSYQASDMEMLINCSITKFKGGLSNRFEPALAHFISHAIGLQMP